MKLDLDALIKLDDRNIDVIIQQRPDLIDKLDLSDLETYQMVDVLVKRPDLANKFESKLQSLSSTHKSLLIRAHPHIFTKHFDVFTLYESDFYETIRTYPDLIGDKKLKLPTDLMEYVLFISKHPEYIDSFDAKFTHIRHLLENDHWCILLRAQPQFIEHYPLSFDYENGGDLSDICRIMLAHEDVMNYIKSGFDENKHHNKFRFADFLKSIDNNLLVELILQYDSLVNYFHLIDLDSCSDNQLSSLLVTYPDLINKMLAYRCKLRGSNIAYVLNSNPELHEYFDLGKLNQSDWTYLIRFQPQLEKYCHSIHTFVGEYLVKLIVHCKGYDHLVNDSRIGFKDKVALMSRRPDLFTNDDVINEFKSGLCNNLIDVYNRRECLFNILKTRYDILDMIDWWSDDSMIWVDLAKFDKRFIEYYGLGRFINYFSTDFIEMFPHLIDKEEITLEDLGI